MRKILFAKTQRNMKYQKMCTKALMVYREGDLPDTYTKSFMEAHLGFDFG